MRRKSKSKRWLAIVAIALLLSPPVQAATAAAKIDCSPVTNKSDSLPRTIAIGTNPAGTGAHALGSGLAAVARTVIR